MYLKSKLVKHNQYIKSLLYILGLNNVIYQLYFNKTGNSKHLPLVTGLHFHMVLSNEWKF